MKKLMLVLALMLLLVLSASAAEPFRVGMECNYAPYNWTQTDPSDLAVPLPAGYADGYDVQIARLIAQGLGRELVVVKTEWDGLPQALQSGRIDAIIAGMSATQERRLVIDFTSNYYESALVVVVRKDGPYVQAKSLADFAGAKITGQLNTFHYGVIDQMPGVLKQTAMDDFPAMTVALSSGRIDGYISERPGAISAMAANSDLTYVDFAEGDGFAVSPDDTAVAVGLQKGSPLLAPINEILAGISVEQREQIMLDALARQPLQK